MGTDKGARGRQLGIRNWEGGKELNMDGQDRQDGKAPKAPIRNEGGRKAHPPPPKVYGVTGKAQGQKAPEGAGGEEKPRISRMSTDEGLTPAPHRRDCGLAPLSCRLPPTGATVGWRPCLADSPSRVE